MKILHTSDWHIGKRLGRHDRMDEFVEVLAEVERIADEQRSTWSSSPATCGIARSRRWTRSRSGSQTLLRLAERRPVVASPGNHDSPELFEALAPLLRRSACFLIGDVKRPDEGGILGPESSAVPAVVAGFPFLREGRVVDFMKEAGEWYGEYADRVAAITAATTTRWSHAPAPTWCRSSSRISW